MQIQHNQLNFRRLGGVAAFLGCLIAATGCASDQEARRGETTTARERARDQRVVTGDRVRDGRSAEVVREGDPLEDGVGVEPVPIADASDVRDNVGERENVRDNVRDRDPTRSVDDRQLKSRIRQSIVDDEALSNRAKNVEIITQNGAVTLRGPVATDDEKARIERHAQDQAGAKRVTNQLEVVR